MTTNEAQAIAKGPPTDEEIQYWRLMALEHQRSRWLRRQIGYWIGWIGGTGVGYFVLKDELFKLFSKGG